MKHHGLISLMFFILASLVARADLPTLTKSTRKPVNGSNLEVRGETANGTGGGLARSEGEARPVSTEPTAGQSRSSAYLPLLGPAPLRWQVPRRPPMPPPEMATIVPNVENSAPVEESPAVAATEVASTVTEEADPATVAGLSAPTGGDSQRLDADTRRLAPLRAFQGGESQPMSGLEEFLRYFRQKSPPENGATETPAETTQAPDEAGLRFVPARLLETVPDSSATYRQVP